MQAAYECLPVAPALPFKLAGGADSPPKQKYVAKDGSGSGSQQTQSKPAPKPQQPQKPQQQQQNKPSSSQQQQKNTGKPAQQKNGDGNRGGQKSSKQQGSQQQGKNAGSNPFAGPHPRNQKIVPFGYPDSDDDDDGSGWGKRRADFPCNFPNPLNDLVRVWKSPVVPKKKKRGPIRFDDPIETLEPFPVCPYQWRRMPNSDDI